MMKFWKRTLWKWAVSTTPSGTFFLLSLFRRKISESVKPSDPYPKDPNLVNGTNNLNVLVFVLHVCLRTSLRLAHTAYFNWSLWTSHRTLLASLSKNFPFSDIKRGRRNSSSNNWGSVRLGRTNVFKQDDTIFRHVSKCNPKNLANRLLHGGFIISLMKFIIF